jgi:hypothetical protein
VAEIDPDNPKILHRLARVYTRLERPLEALDVYDRIQPPVSSKDTAPARAMLQLQQQTAGAETNPELAVVGDYYHELEITSEAEAEDIQKQFEKLGYSAPIGRQAK